MTKETFFKILDSKIQSVLLYSSEIWGLHILDSIEKVHLVACKRYLGVPSRIPNKMVYEELGRCPPLLSHTFVIASQYVACICTDPLSAYLILLECLPTYCNNAIKE